MPNDRVPASRSGIRSSGSSMKPSSDTDIMKMIFLIVASRVDAGAHGIAGKRRAGGAYLFRPSARGLEWIASLPLLTPTVRDS